MFQNFGECRVLSNDNECAGISLLLGALQLVSTVQNTVPPKNERAKKLYILPVYAFLQKHSHYEGTPMAHEEREGSRDDSHNGEIYLRSTDASQYHLSENEQVQRQLQSTVSINDGPIFVFPYHATRSKVPPPSSSQCLNYAPWHAPPPHPGFQEQRYERYAVPSANGPAPGGGVWYETRQNCPLVPPVPAMVSPLFMATLYSLTLIIFSGRFVPIHTSGCRANWWCPSTLG